MPIRLGENDKVSQTSIYKELFWTPPVGHFGHKLCSTVEITVLYYEVLQNLLDFIPF